MQFVRRGDRPGRATGQRPSAPACTGAGVSGAVISLKVTESAETTGSATYPGSATQLTVRDFSVVQLGDTRQDRLFASVLL